MRTKNALLRAWRFLTAWLEEIAPPDGEPPYQLCAELAFQHRLEPLLGVSELPADLPSWMTERFRAVARATRAAQIERFAAVQEVLAILRPWPVVVFKGFAAAELLYSDIGARSMGDVDLLVLAEHFQPVREVLVAAGFQQAFVGNPVLDHPTHHERELTNGSLTVDLHQAFTQIYRIPLDYKQLFSRSLPWTELAPNARVLSAEDAVLAQAIHLAIGELTPQAAPVIGVCDLRLMLRPQRPFWHSLDNPPLDTQRVSALAARSGAERMLFAVLSYARRLFPGPSDILDASPPLISPGTRRVLDLLVRRAFPPALHNPPRLEMIWRKAMLLPSGRRRALLLRQLPLQLRYHLGRLLGRFE